MKDASEPFAFLIGAPVKKISGDYLWPGIVVSRFHTLKGKARYVVECTAPGAAGALHIFSAANLTHRKEN